MALCSRIFRNLEKETLAQQTPRIPRSHITRHPITEEMSAMFTPCDDFMKAGKYFGSCSDLPALFDVNDNLDSEPEECEHNHHFYSTSSIAPPIYMPEDSDQLFQISSFSRFPIPASADLPKQQLQQPAEPNSPSLWGSSTDLFLPYLSLPISNSLTHLPSLDLALPASPNNEDYDAEVSNSPLSAVVVSTSPFAQHRSPSKGGIHKFPNTNLTQSTWSFASIEDAAPNDSLMPKSKSPVASPNYPRRSSSQPSSPASSSSSHSPHMPKKRKLRHFDGIDSDDDDLSHVGDFTVLQCLGTNRKKKTRCKNAALMEFVGPQPKYCAEHIFLDPEALYHKCGFPMTGQQAKVFLLLFCHLRAIVTASKSVF
jgi:hypothetical protein